MHRMAEFFGRHQLMITCVVVVVTLVCLSGVALVRFDNDPERLLRSAEFDPRQFDTEIAQLDRTLLIVVEGEHLMTREGVNTIRKIVQGTSELEGIEAVYSLLSVRDRRRVGRYLLPLFPSPDASPERFERAKTAAATHPLLIGQFLSKDMQTSLVILQLGQGEVGPRRFIEILRAARSLIDECTEGSGLRARITGGPALDVEIFEHMRADISRFTGLGIALGLGIAVVMFGRISVALIVASGPALGALWYVGTLGIIGQPINILTSVVPLLVVVIGFTDSMHLVLHMRRALESGSSHLEAAQSAIRNLGLACGLTTLSTVVGFGSLTLARLEGIKTFGWCCSLGSLISFFAVMIVVPLLASSRLGRVLIRRNPPGHRIPLEPWADVFLSGILRCPRTVLVGSVILTCTLGLIAMRLEPDHRIATVIPDTSEPYQALMHVDNTFGGIMFAYATVEWPETPSDEDRTLRSQGFYDILGEVHGVFDSSELASNALSILNVVQSLPGEDKSLSQRASQLKYLPEEHLRQLINVSARRVVVSARLPDVGARRLNPEFTEIERQLAAISRRHPGYTIELTGGTVVALRSIHLMIEDLWWSLGTAAGVMFLMIWIGLRSLRLALISIIPNIFPLLCTAAFIVLSGRSLELTSVIVFSISLGIAVDDTIHFLVHFQREMQVRADTRWAIRRTLHVVGKALIMTTLVLVGGHAIVMLSGFPTVRVFGMLTALTIACALLGDLLILPSILVSLGAGPSKANPSGGSSPPAATPR